MSSRVTDPNWLVRLAIAAATLLASGCQNYAERRDTIAFHAGEAGAYNRAVHTIDPWPAASANNDIEFDGRRMARAIELYEEAQAAAAAAPSPGVTSPAP
jgi:hypothetical protein